MTIKDLLIKRGWVIRSGWGDGMGPYLINIRLVENGLRDELFRRYYYETDILTDADDNVIVHNPSIKLLWLMRLI